MPRQHSRADRTRAQLDSAGEPLDAAATAAAAGVRNDGEVRLACRSSESGEWDDGCVEAYPDADESDEADGDAAAADADTRG